jgi:hypothetical protein
MKKSITQESDFGCGIACFAFATNSSYKQASKYLGNQQANSDRFWAKDFSNELNRAGKKYHHKYLKPKLAKNIYKEGTIVLIRRSKIYPSGHYLIRHEGQWMDPWINLAFDKDINSARSGYRKRLPGKPMYALFPG